jgi:hypothetical protein
LVSWTVVSEQICDLIKDENGITVDPSDLKYQRGEDLKVLLFGFDFTSIDVDYLDESDDEDIAYMIVESVDSLAKRVTENRIKYLESTIQPIIDEVTKAKGVKLSYEIENRGYMGRVRHYLNESEYERDYPDLVILIRGGKKIVELPLDPYQADEPFDVYDLKEKI